MHSVFTHIRKSLTLILLGVALLSCRKDEPHHVQRTSQEKDKDVVSAWMSLDINVVSSGEATKSHVGEVDGGTNNSIDENAIKRLAIWLVPAEGGVADWSKAIMTYIPDISSWTGSQIVSVRTKLNVPMYVYAAANISTDIAAAFLSGGPDAVYNAASSDYPEMIAEFASSDKGVAMFCTRLYNITFVESNSNKSTPAKIDENGDSIEDVIDLVRMLAKVHVLFQCYDSHPEFVKITKPDSFDAADFGEFGWSRLEDISYILNTVNKSTKIMQSIPEVGHYDSYKDLNHIMTDFLEKGLEWEYKVGAENQYLGFAEDITADHDDDWNKWSAKPERFEANKAPFGTCSAGKYVNGLYCLENTTDDSSLSLMTDDEKKYVPFMVATHVVVKARFVPRRIIYTTDVSGQPVTNEFEVEGYNEALAFLEAKNASESHTDIFGNSIVDENGDPADYPQGTFFTRDMKEFYSYDGMIKVMDSKDYARKSFAAYPGGYGFYYSYISGGTGASGQVTFNGFESGIFRNHYHILNCQLMKVPAVPGSLNHLMMVNSTIVDWNPKGVLNLIVKPNV